MKLVTLELAINIVLENSMKYITMVFKFVLLSIAIYLVCLYILNVKEVYQKLILR